MPIVNSSKEFVLIVSIDTNSLLKKTWKTIPHLQAWDHHPQYIWEWEHHPRMSSSLTEEPGWTMAWGLLLPLPCSQRRDGRMLACCHETASADGESRVSLHPPADPSLGKGKHIMYSSPSILQPFILRPPMIIRPLDLVPMCRSVC